MLKCHSCSGKFGLVGDPANERKRVIEREIKKKQHSSHGSWKFTIKQLPSYAFIKPLFGIGIVYALNEWSGFQTLITYTFEIFEETGSIIDPGIILIITASTRVLFAGMGFISIQTQHSNFCQQSKLCKTIGVKQPITYSYRNGQFFHFQISTKGLRCHRNS